jgi:hypothetical protein
MTEQKTEPPKMLDIFETAVRQLIIAFEVERPPVPIELMLKRPKPNMWQEVNLSDLSISFINIKHLHSPRMSVARLLARHMCRSAWGQAQGLAPYSDDEEAVRALARALVMPFSMLAELSFNSRTEIMISSRFEVPEDDVRLRLIELGIIAK